MKTLARSIVASILAFLARGILHKYKPLIVMVTGSVGKTSTKDAVAAALSGKYFLRASEKSYNSEFGVPLTIIGAKNPWADPLAWMRVFQEALALIFLPSHYPRLLVLEVGADRPGDLAQILRIATPDAVVVTRLPEVPVHVEAYASPQAVREEEFTPAYALPAGAPLIISADDAYAKQLSERLSARVLSFGLDANATVRFSYPRVYEEDGVPVGMEADVRIGDESHVLRAPGGLGSQQLYAPAAALTTAIALGLSTEEALASVQKYVSPQGRARILKGKHGAVLIDDSYNASPAAVEVILNSLTLVPNIKRKIVILGDMLELGRYSAEEHERVGTLAAKEADILIAVGERSRVMADAALRAGKNEKDALAFPDAHEAAEKVCHMLKAGDLVLIKGSQGMRMERLTERLLKDPTDAKYLVRQEKQWLRRK